MLSFEEDIRFWIIRRRDKSVDGHTRSKKQIIIIIIFLCDDDDEERSPFPLPPVVSKENDPARLLISQKEAHATTVVDARSEEKERARGRERFSSALHSEIFPTKRKKKTKISPSHQSRRNASHLFTREFALQFLSAETVETDCARKENISSLLLRRSRGLYSLV